MGSIRRKSLDQPDEVRPFPLGAGEITRLGAYTLGRAVLRPGWRWSTHMGPIMGTPSCPVHHLQLIVSGRFGVRMDDGEEAELGPSDLADIPAGHDAWVIGDEPAVVLDFAGNVDAVAVPAEHRRMVATLLMTDIVDSTKTAARMGDAAWRQLLDDHNRAVRVLLTRYDGSEINTTGDGFLATFATAGGALRCALAIHDAVAGLEIGVRIGVHTGEIELADGGIRGIAVHAVARIMALGGSGDTLVSSVTATLAEGSGFRLEEHGRHEVKGFERPIEVHRLAR